MTTEIELLKRMLHKYQTQDFFMLPNEEGETVALYIAQPESEEPLVPNAPGCMAVRLLAAHEDLPFFLIRYAADFSRHSIQPINGKAKTIFPETATVDWAGWVEFGERCREHYENK